MDQNFSWTLDYCHTRLHLGFSAKLRIWQVPACKMEPRSGIIFCKNPTRPDRPDPTTQSSFKTSILQSMSYNPCLHVWPFSNKVRRVLKRNLEDVWRVSGKCLKGVWKVSGRCPKTFSDTEFFWHCRIFQLLLNFSGTRFFRPTIFEPKNSWTKSISDQIF